VQSRVAPTIRGKTGARSREAAGICGAGDSMREAPARDRCRAAADPRVALIIGGFPRSAAGCMMLPVSESAEERVASLVGRLEELERPAEVIDAAIAVMAERFRVDGFVWGKSRSMMRRTVDGRQELFGFDRSPRNRAGVLIEFSVAYLRVTDDRLADWRNANPGLTLDRPASVWGIVAASSFYDICRSPSAYLTNPQTRVAQLDALCGQINQIALPWFASPRDPEQLARAVSQALLDPFAFAVDLVEFLISRDQHDQARSLIERVLAQGPARQTAFDQGRERARRGDRPRWHSAESLGWCSTVLGLM
jgi:hypothetical protein